MKFKKGIYNIIFNILSQLITLGLGIVIPRLFLVSLGSEANGLVSSIGQVYTYIALLEAGIGLSTTQALYKPVVENNREEINHILSASDSYYRKMGRYYILAVIIFSLVYPLFIKSNIDKFTIISVILLSGLGGAINFFLQNKYTVLLNADGKNYVMTSINMVINVLIYIAKIVLLMLGYNLIAIQLSQFIITLLRILILERYMQKNYGWINFKLKPNFEAISQRHSVLIHQISYMIFSNTDILVLTIFCDLKVVSVYTIYSMLIGVIEGIVSNVNSGANFLFGQIYNEDKAKFINFFDIYEVMYMILVFSSFITVQVFGIPFIKLYTSGISDINYIDPTLLTLFVLLKLLTSMRAQCFTTINVAGHFQKTQKSSIIEAIINLGSSIILVNLYGIYGVLCGSIIGLIYRALYCVIYTNKNILNRSPLITVKRWSANMCIYLIVIYTSRLVQIDLDSYVLIFRNAILYYIVVIILVSLVNMILNRRVLYEIKNYLYNYLKNKKVYRKKYMVRD